MTIELRHLRYVIAAAEQGSFRRAALSVGVQVSAVSRCIRDLEDKMGSALFIRNCSGVQLTYAGELFVRRARKAVNQINYAEKDVSAVGRGEDGVVRIGIFSSLASGFIADLIESYSALHADVRLDFFEGGPSDHIPAIRRHQLDVAFLTGDPLAEDCDTAHLWDERVYVAMPVADDLVDLEEIEWDNLRSRHFIVSEAQPGPEIHDYLMKNLAALGHTLSIHQQAVYRDTLMQIVAKGRGLTLTSEATIATQFPGVVYRPLAGEILPFCAIWSPTNDNPAFRRLLSLAKLLSKHHAASPVTNGFADPSEE